MKKTLTVIALLSIVGSAHAKDCKLSLQVKKSGAKTFYLGNGEKLSNTMKKRLAPFCDFSINVMSEKDAKALKIKALVKKLAKARG